MTKRTSVHFTDRSLSILERTSGSLSEGKRVNQVMDRYVWLMDRARVELLESFNPVELRAVASVLDRQTAVDVSAGQAVDMLLTSVREAQASGRFEGLEVDGTSLGARVAAMSPVHCLALLEWLAEAPFERAALETLVRKLDDGQRAALQAWIDQTLKP